MRATLMRCRRALRFQYRAAGLLRAAVESGWAEWLAPFVPGPLLFRVTRPKWRKSKHEQDEDYGLFRRAAAAFLTSQFVCGLRAAARATSAAELPNLAAARFSPCPLSLAAIGPTVHPRPVRLRAWLWP